jgi:DNA-binding Lrp family transcriptional regulator
VSIKIISAVWAIELHGSDLLVLLALADHARDDGTSCYPSVNRIAWMTSLSVRTVQYALRRLQKSGLIEQVAKARRHRPTEYAIHLERGKRKMLLVKATRGAEIAPLAGSGVQPKAARGADDRDRDATAIAHEPSIEPTMIRPEPSSPEVAERFAREIRQILRSEKKPPILSRDGTTATKKAGGEQLRREGEMPTTKAMCPPWGRGSFLLWTCLRRLPSQLS